MQLLLEELGYDVADPEEIAPATFYPALAQGDYDLWASSWPLNHTPLLDGESPDGGTFGDRVRYIGTIGVLAPGPGRSTAQRTFSSGPNVAGNPTAAVAPL